MNSLFKITVFLMLATGCGPDLGKMNHYKAGCLNFYSDLELNPQTIGWNAKLAGVVMTKQGSFTNVLFSSTPTFCDFYKDTAIIVEDVDGFSCDSEGKNCEEIGYYSITAGIHIVRDGSNLPHELFHLKDAIELKPGTYWHENWDKNGYETASQEYNVLRHTEMFATPVLN